MDSIPLNERKKNASATRQSRTFDPNSQNAHPRIKKGVNPKFCVNAKLWCKIEQKYFKAGAAQAAAALVIK